MIRFRLSTFTASDGNPATRITISDNGKGISSDNIKRVFDALFTTKGQISIGLGLWVSKQLTEKMEALSDSELL